MTSSVNGSKQRYASTAFTGRRQRRFIPFFGQLSLALSLYLRQTILPLIVERKNLSWLNDDEASAKLQEEKFDLTNVPQG